MTEMLHVAPTVVIADLMSDGSSSEVAIRPTIWLRGELPVDDDGLYRFEWTEKPSSDSGVWLFGPDGQPLTDEQSVADDHPYPWWSTEDYMLYEEFPAAVLTEAGRVLDEADLVVELSSHSNSVPPLLGESLIVDQILSGGGTVAVGDRITFTHSGEQSANNKYDYYLGSPTLWALSELPGGGWETVPSWLSTGWLCSDLPVLAALEKFSDYSMSQAPDTGDSTACLEQLSRT